MKTESIPNPELAHFLKRGNGGSRPVDLSSVLVDTLRRANDFVPSQAGAILLDDPGDQDDGDDALVVVASFGNAGQRRVGRRVGLAEGPEAFDAYSRGEASCRLERTHAELDDTWRGGPDFVARSILCVPLRQENVVIGVLELVNDQAGAAHGRQELELLEIFALTISASISHAVEAERSKEMARRDDLTGLYNDRYLHTALSEHVDLAIEGDEECGLMFLDLDFFKRVNDAHGHLVGSRVLQEVGSILRRVLPGPSVAARYGGDEFVVLLPQSLRQEMVWAAETVRQTISTHVFLESEDPEDPVIYPALGLRITCSVGLAALREEVLPAGPNELSRLVVKNEWIRLADARMYEAKDRGKNRIVFDGRGMVATVG